MRTLLLRFACLAYIILYAVPTFAAETRGLAVIAKDPATNQSGEVRLYNKSYAVIIGIDKYLNLPPDRQLQNAVKDAQGVQEVLTRHYRFDRIFTLYDQQATKDRILELLTEELPQGMSDQDSVFIFWAGHGNQQKSKDGEMGYLIPYDGNPAKLRTVVTMAEIRDTISKAIPAKHVFYVMDACYSGLLTATRAVDSKPRRDLAYLKEITKERVRQVLTAGGKDQEVLDGGSKGHSVFTGRLIEVLEATGDFITANEIQAIIKEKVYGDARARNHNQTPGYGTLYGSGDFVFVPFEQDNLADLTATTVARQKELEQLKQLELEAATKQKERQEVSRKQVELLALDKQIAEVKGKQGTKVSRSNDRLFYTDPTTGLLWVRNGNIAGKKMEWKTAKSWVKKLKYAGYNDWRLPTKEELETFIKRAGENPYKWFNSNGFKNVKSFGYWTTSTSSVDKPWFLNMLDGRVSDDLFDDIVTAPPGEKTFGYFAWPVRAGQ